VLLKDIASSTSAPVLLSQPCSDSDAPTRQMEEETRDRLMRLFDWGRQIFHVAYIPFILYLGGLSVSELRAARPSEKEREVEKTC